MNYIWANAVKKKKQTKNTQIFSSWNVKKLNTRRHERQSKMRRVHFDDSLVNAIEQTTKYIKCVQQTDEQTLRVTMRRTHVISPAGSDNRSVVCARRIAFVSQVNLFDLMLCVVVRTTASHCWCRVLRCSSLLIMIWYGVWQQHDAHMKCV